MTQSLFFLDSILTVFIYTLQYLCCTVLCIFVLQGLVGVEL
jgi:hypothetical protein